MIQFHRQHVYNMYSSSYLFSVIWNMQNKACVNLQFTSTFLNFKPIYFLYARFLIPKMGTKYWGLLQRILRKTTVFLTNWVKVNSITFSEWLITWVLAFRPQNMLWKAYVLIQQNIKGGSCSVVLWKVTLKCFWE